MTPEAFQYWLWTMHPNANRSLNNIEAATLLGCSRVTVAEYKTKGAPKFVALACSALSRGLSPWDLQPIQKDSE